MIRNGGTGILTLTPSGTDTIDGNVNQQLQLTESLVLVSDGSNWNTFGYGRSNSFAYTQLSLSVTGGTTVLTASQAANTIQYYSGALTSNQIIQVPSTVQFYIISNYTTGAYTFTVKTVTGGALTVTIGQSSTLTVYCDGTNVFNASSGATGGGGSSTFTTVTLGNGSTSVPSLKFAGDLNSGLYLPSSGQVGIVVTNAQAGYFDSTGLTIVGKVAASGVVSGTLGTFSGAVSGTTGTFSSVVSGTLGTFSGAVSGTTGTFSGAVSGTTGTFTGAVSGTTGTFTTGITGGTF
jgi:hypothetical protein